MIISMLPMHYLKSTKKCKKIIQRTSKIIDRFSCWVFFYCLNSKWKGEMDMQELAGMKVYSLKDVCKLLKIGPKKGLELFNNNEFPAQRVGRSW